MAGGLSFYPILPMLGKLMPMRMNACFFMFSTMVIEHLRCWLRNLNKVEVMTAITMMAVEKCCKPVSLRTGVKEKSPAIPGIWEYRRPPLYSRDPSHCLLSASVTARGPAD